MPSVFGLLHSPLKVNDIQKFTFLENDVGPYFYTEEERQKLKYDVTLDETVE